MRGRKPKPTALRIIEGNPGRRPINRNEPKPRPLRPSCPKWLSKEAKREWRRLVPELERIGLLTLVDRGALAALCQSWARYVEAEEQVARYGAVLKVGAAVQTSPYVTQAKHHLALYLKACAEFGLTPSSRSRISLPGKGEEEECGRCGLPQVMCGCGG